MKKRNDHKHDESIPRNKHFSHKQKKNEMKLNKLKQQEKRRKALEEDLVEQERIYQTVHGDALSIASLSINKGLDLNVLPPVDSDNPLNTVFIKDDTKSVEARKLLSRMPYSILPPDSTGQTHDDTPIIFADIPIRPIYHKNMNKEELEANEQEYFKEYLYSIHNKLGVDDNCLSINQFEHNLEVWRQLWRVTEKSDVVLILTDIRFANLTYPRALHLHLQSISKPFVIVLNKCDLVSEELQAKWKLWFQTLFPRTFVTLFCQYNDGNPQQYADNSSSLLHAIRNALVEDSGCNEGLKELYSQLSFEATRTNQDETLKIEPEIQGKRSPFVSIGLVGLPNAGKSSFINCLCKKVLVSVSKTPGHTKHFQTIFLNRFTRLIDCPGLVFPVYNLPYPVQVLSGQINIAQVREGYTTLSYVGSRFPLTKVLNLQPSMMNEDALPHEEHRWSGYEIATSFAIKKSYFTSKNMCNPDAHRAANELLRNLQNGKIAFYLAPPPH
jgi:ribosome biogenesis GTPase A